MIRKSRSRSPRKRERKSKGPSVAEREKQQISSPSHGQETTSFIAVTSTNTSGEIECSVEETNRIRAALGLKPLSSTSSNNTISTKERYEPEKLAKERNTLEVQAKIDRLKDKQISTITGKSLGEKLAEEEGANDVSAWVTKSREKEMAEKRAKMLDDQDQDLEQLSTVQNRTRNQKALHSSKDLNGVQVTHDMGDLEDAIILTLKDTPILQDADTINEAEDQLENIKISEKERLQRNLLLKKKKPTYSVYDDGSGSKPILSQYDEPTTKPVLSITSTGIIDPAKQELDEVRKKLALGKNVYNLQYPKALATEYFTQQEMEVKFNKVAAEKKKKLRKKKEVLELTPLDGPNVDRTPDHGSRKDASKTKIDEQRAEEEEQRRAKNYAKALEKAATSSKLLSHVDHDEETLFQSLTYAKNKLETPNIRNKEPDKTIAELVLMRAQEHVKIADREQDSLILTSTSEFVRGIPLEDSTGQQIKKTKKEIDVDMEDRMIDEDIEDHHKMILAQAKKEGKQRQQDPVSDLPKVPLKSGNFQEEEEEEEEVLDSEPLVASGIAATLQLLKRQGGVELDSYAGRKTDKRLAEELPEINKDNKRRLLLERVDSHGRIMTPKEAFREISHVFHGKRSGKNKQEKQIREWQEDIKRKTMLATDTPLNTVAAIQSEQERTQSAFIVLSGISATEPDPAPVVQQANVRKGGPKEGQFQQFKLQNNTK